MDGLGRRDARWVGVFREAGGGIVICRARLLGGRE